MRVRCSVTVGLSFASLCGCGDGTREAATIEPLPPDPQAYIAQLEDLARGVQPPGADGWPMLQQACAELAEIIDRSESGADTGFVDFRLLYEDGEFYQPEDRVLTQRAYDAVLATDLVERATRALRHPRHVRGWEVHRDALQTVLEDSQHIRAFARLRTAMFDLALKRGKTTEALLAVEDVLLLARHLSACPALIDRLIAESVEALVTSRVYDAVERSRLREAELRELLAIYERHVFQPMSNQLLGERLIFEHTVRTALNQQAVDSGKAMEFLMTARQIREDGILSILGEGAVDLSGPALRIPSAEEMIHAFRGRFDPLLADIDRPPPQRAPIPSTDALPEELSYVAYSVDAFALAIRQADEAEARRRAAPIVLALHLFRLQHGRFPTALDALVPAILGAPPLDPYSARPFRYELLDRGGKFLLYSVGPNGEPDGGTPRILDQHDYDLRIPRAEFNDVHDGA